MRDDGIVMVDAVSRLLCALLHVRDRWTDRDGNVYCDRCGPSQGRRRR